MALLIHNYKQHFMCNYYHLFFIKRNNFWRLFVTPAIPASHMGANLRSGHSISNPAPCNMPGKAQVLGTLCPHERPGKAPGCWLWLGTSPAIAAI